MFARVRLRFAVGKLCEKNDVSVRRIPEIVHIGEHIIDFMDIPRSLRENGWSPQDKAKLVLYLATEYERACGRISEKGNSIGAVCEEFIIRHDEGGKVLIKDIERVFREYLTILQYKYKMPFFTEPIFD